MEGPDLVAGTIPLLISPTDSAEEAFVEAIAAVRGGLTLGVVIAKATAFAKIRIKQFWAIRLAGKVVAGRCMMAMPLFLFDRDVGPHSRTHGAVGKIDSGGDRYSMKTFHEWLAERMAKNEGLWLNDKNAVIGLSQLNPLPKNSAVN